jgi:prepilin-type processing-associated H-X9-DG protein
MAIMMYVQDNNEILPAAANAWSSISLSAGVLKCPDYIDANGYVFNANCAGQALGSFSDATIVPLTADGNTTTSPLNPFNPPISNVSYFDTDLDYSRHNNGLIASWLDGHVTYATNGVSFQTQMLGTLTSPTTTGEILTVVNPSANGSTPSCTLPTSGWTGSLQQTAVGSNGFVLYGYNGGNNPDTATSNIDETAVTGAFTSVGVPMEQLNNNPQIMTGGGQGMVGYNYNGSTNTNWNYIWGCASSVGDKALPITVAITPANESSKHILTVVCPQNLWYIRYMQISLVGAGSTTGPIYDYTSGETGSIIAQFSFIGNVTLTLTDQYAPTDPNMVGWSSTEQGVALGAIFLD